MSNNTNHQLVIPPLGRPGLLATMGNIRTEMGRVYRKAANGEITGSEAKSFIWMLKMIFDAERDAGLEARLDRIEERMERQ